MNNNKTIKGMKKSELLAIFDETIDKVNSINSSIDTIKSCESDVGKTISRVKKAEDKIFGCEDDTEDSGYLNKIEHSLASADQNYKEIVAFHGQLVTDDELNESVKTKLDSLVNKFTDYNQDFAKLRNEMFGYQEENEKGEIVKIDGYIEKIKQKLKTQEERYNTKFDEINNLLSSATTVSLAKQFKDKANGYKRSRRMWEYIIVASFITIIYILTFSLYIKFNELSKTNIVDTVKYFISFIPTGLFVVWFITVASNRRAENKKLEESYNHKLSMAESYVGYRESISELDEDDDTLLKQHMQNLLYAISKDPSVFLSTKGEKHPVSESTDKLIRSASNINPKN